MWLLRCCEKKWEDGYCGGERVMLVVAGASCRAPRVNSHTGVSTPTNCASDRSVRSFNAQLCSNAQVTLCWCALNNQHCCFYVGRWRSTEAASCCTFPRRLKRATQSDRGALLSFPLLICSQLDVRARIWHKSSLPIVSILAFTVPFCNNQVAVTFSLKPTQHPLSSSVATASLYLWPIQAKPLFLFFSMHYLIYANSKHGSQPFQRQPFWHLDKNKCTNFADLTYCPLQIVLVAFSWFVSGSFFQRGPDSLVTKWQIISSRIIGWCQM